MLIEYHGVKFCPFCGKELEIVLWDAGQCAVPAPWCESCKVGLHHPTIKEARMPPTERHDYLIGKIDRTGEVKKTDDGNHAM